MKQIEVYQTLSFSIEDPFSDDDQSSRIEIIHAYREFYGFPRYDWFLIYDPEKSPKTYGMDRYKVGQICLFLKIVQNGEKYQLAYVNWFEKRKKKDEETGMFIVDCSKKFNIIDVMAIVQSIHLQPLFHKRDSAIQAHSRNWNVYSFDTYLVNKYSDRDIWEMLY